MDTLARIKDLAAKEFSIDPTGLDPAAPLDSFGIDSLSFIEFMFKIEEEFDLSIPDEDIQKLRTVGDVIAYLEAAGPSAKARKTKGSRGHA